MIYNMFGGVLNLFNLNPEYVFPITVIDLLNLFVI